MTDVTNETKAPLTKEEKIAKIEAQIVKLKQRIEDIINGVVRVKASKVVVLPNVGDVVDFTYGRTTPTTSARELTGIVIGVKPAAEADGKRTPALVRVQVGDGFDAEILTIYPAQIKEPGESTAGENEEIDA